MVKNGELHRAFVKILLKYPVKNIKFFDGKISLTFFGHRISDKVIVKKEDHVAEWSRRRKEIFVDKNMANKSMKALCVHETIEKFLVDKFGLELDSEAHIVATQKEREYLNMIGGNWRSHELAVYWEWHRQGEH